MKNLFSTHGGAVLVIALLHAFYPPKTHIYCFSLITPPLSPFLAASCTLQFPLNPPLPSMILELARKML